MNKSVSMMTLDFYSIKEYTSGKYIGIFVGILILFAVMMDSPAPAIGMFMVYGMFYSGYPFAVGEKVRLDVLYASLPLSRSSLILGRYLFALAVNIVTGLASFAVCLCVGSLRGIPMDPLESMFIVTTCFFIYSAMEFLQFPFFFKLGYNKARLFILLPIVLVAAATSTLFLAGDGLFSQLDGLIQWLGANSQLLVIVLFGLWLLLFYGSIRLSHRFYAKREL